MPMVNSSLGVHIYIHITVYQFALLYVRSQPNSTTWSSDNYRLLKEVNGVTAFTTKLDLSDLDQEIQTAYAYYHQFANLCSEKLSFPTEEELKEFNSSERLTAVPFSTL